MNFKDALVQSCRRNYCTILPWLALFGVMLTLTHESFKLPDDQEVRTVSSTDRLVKSKPRWSSEESYTLDLDIPYGKLGKCKPVYNIRDPRVEVPPFDAESYQQNMPLNLEPKCKEAIKKSKKEGDSWNLLDESLCRHRFLWIGGNHFSGTSLTKFMTMTLPYVAGHNEPGWPDEGHHIQRAYPNTGAYGGPCRCNVDSHLFKNESDPLLEDPLLRPCLYDSWVRFWNISQPILVEKSPMSHTQLRFREQIFPSVAASIVSVRHPLYACFIRKLDKERSKQEVDWSDLERLIGALKGWLNSQENLADTLKSNAMGWRDRVKVLMFEDFFAAETHVAVAALDSMVMDFFPELKAYFKKTKAPRHRSLYFRKGAGAGSKEHPVVDTNLLFGWVPAWELWKEENKLVYENRIRPVLEHFEPRVQEYGYSLFNAEIDPKQFHKAFYGTEVADEKEGLMQRLFSKLKKLL